MECEKRVEMFGLVAGPRLLERFDDVVRIEWV